jgi:hypothetical protein
MRKSLRPIATLFAAFAVLLASSAVRTRADNPRQAAIRAAALAKSAIDAARKAHAEAEKAEKDKAEDVDKKREAERKTLADAQSALKAAKEALAAIPEGQDLSTQKKVGSQLDELDATLKTLEFIEAYGLDAMVQFNPQDADAKKRAQEAVNNAFDEVEKAIKKLPPEKQKNLQGQIEDRRKELLGHLALGALPGKATDTDASVVPPSSTSGDGLRTVTFDTLQGRVIVNLPDDVRAGDTISGTVAAEPKGQTDEERARHMPVLTADVIQIVTKKPDGTTDSKVNVPVTATGSPFTIKLPPTITLTPPLKSVSSGSSGGLGITLTNTSGSFTTGGTATIPIEMVSLSLQSVAPLTVHQFPTMGQQGRPIVITGPFDGNSSNTGLYYRPCVRAVDCAGTPSAWVASGDLIVAESPRQAVFTAPTNVTGPMEIRVNEGTTETKAPFRNVGIKLTAPTTTLPKGGSTVVTGEATGVGGSQQPIPIHVECTGQVDMQGGNSQTLQAPPSSDPNAKFVFNLPITATKGPGPFSVTATVVVFNVCLQDDSNGNQISINSTTGDYRFCNVFPTVVAGDSGRVDVVWYGTTTPETGAVTKAGCIITLQHNSKDGRVQAQIDRCTQTGNATVQPASSKTTFTITDKDTTNNTCTCK